MLSILLLADRVLDSKHVSLHRILEQRDDELSDLKVDEVTC
jgi:hypothetical protein